jgi:hypothetical protein
MSIEQQAWEVAQRWREIDAKRDAIRDELLSIVEKLLEKYTMSQVAEIVGIKRTTLYYVLWGKDGRPQKIVSRRPFDHSIPVSVEQLREIA